MCTDVIGIIIAAAAAGGGGGGVRNASAVSME
jgi:hypothetical protein